MKRHILFAAGVAALILTGVGSIDAAHACSTISYLEHDLDADEQAADSTEPSAPQLGELEIVRRPEPGGCSNMSTSCDGSGAIGIGVQAQDDRTGVNEMGYTIRLVDGSLPEGMSLPNEPVRPYNGDLLWLNFSDRDQSIGFTVAVRAVDLAGNEGPAMEVDVYDDVGGGGCSSGGRDRASWLLLVGATLLLMRRRRALA